MSPQDNASERRLDELLGCDPQSFRSTRFTSDGAVLTPSNTSRSLVSRLGVAITSIVVMGYGVDAWFAREAALERAIHDARVIARVIEEQTLASINAADLALRTVDHLVTEAGKGEAERNRIDSQLRETARLLPFLHSIIHLDKTGQATHQSDPRPDLSVDLSDRTYFRFHRDSKSTDLHIGDPFVSRRSGGDIFTVSRRLQLADATFNGVLVAGIDIGYLANLYADVDTGYGSSVLLVRSHGTVLVRAPFIEGVIGKPLRDKETFDEHLRKAEAGNYRTAKTPDGVPRIFSYRAVRGRPLVVLLGQSEAEVLASWKRRVLASAAGAAVLVATVILVSLVAFRAFRRRDEALQMVRESEQRARELWRAAAASEASLATAQRITHLGSWELDLDDTGAPQSILRWSDESSRIFGKTPTSDPVSRDSFIEMVHPQDRESVEREVKQSIELRRDLDLQYRIVLRDGATKIVRSRSTVTVDEAGRPRKLIGTVQDITEQAVLESGMIEARTRLKALSDQLLSVQETERASLARELHDEFGQTLTTIKLQLQMAARRMPSTALEDCIALTEEGLRQVRNLAQALRPLQLDDLGLRAALEADIARLARQAAIPICFECADDVPRITGPRAAACFRIAQEGITNAIRHAGARRIRVSLACEGSSLRLEIADDGVGFDFPAMRARAAQGASLGLLSMEERVQILGGEFDIQSAPSRGTCVRATIPLPPAGMA